MSMDVPAVMLGLAAALETVPLPGAGGGTLRAFAFPVDQISPPAAVVAFPEGDIEFDTTFARGADRALFQVFVLVGRPGERTAYPALAAYMSGQGASSIKAALEADPELGGAAAGGTLAVPACRLETVMIGEVPYIAAGFDVDVVA